MAGTGIIRCSLNLACNMHAWVWQPCFQARTVNAVDASPSMEHEHARMGLATVFQAGTIKSGPSMEHEHACVVFATVFSIA